MGLEFKIVYLLSSITLRTFFLFDSEQFSVGGSKETIAFFSFVLFSVEVGRYYHYRNRVFGKLHQEE